MIFEKFCNYIKQEEMISPGEKIIAALSGGIDSMVMLHLLLRFQEDKGGTLVIAHLNHGLRAEESDRDEKFVKKTALHLGLDCHCRRINLTNPRKTLPGNLQAAGREERYAFFNAMAETVKGDKIALGHNADDQAETVLMRIIRGSGISGMGGIPPVREKIIRPMLCLTRKEIAAYASKEGILYVEDSSNLSKKYLRNQIRHELMPLLKSYNPNIKGELNMLSQISRDVSSYLDGNAAEAFQKIKIEPGEEVLFLDLAQFNLLPAALKGKVVSLACHELSGASGGLYSRHILQVNVLAGRGKSASSIDLPGGIKVFIEYGKLAFSLNEGEEISSFSFPLNLEGETALSQLGLTFTSERVSAIEEKDRDDKNVIYLDMERITAPLIVRNFRNGDRIKIKGMEGRKKLKNLYIDEKVPVRFRKKIPLIAAGDEILWVVGLRHGGNAIADCRSKDILKVSKN
ncbi:MAG: tRNA lysidine(34) synthetase TilS [Deltaproteobacteria bacterium]|nr:tRNA lysidine(34) synthetase TilS [Deltaproteobacteria bacterium]